MHCARVDKSCSLVYTSIPKAGCTTIQSILANAWAQSVGKELIHNSHTPMAREYLIYWNSPGRPPIQDLLEKCKFFTVSRNPYSRVLSAWMDKVKGAAKEGVTFARKFKIADPSNISFEKFVDLLMQCNKETFDHHWATQSSICNFDKVPYIHIGNLESLPDTINWINEHLPFPPISEDARFASHSTGSAKKLSKYYTKSLQDKVYTLYEEDFENFGYSRDINLPAPTKSPKNLKCNPDTLKFLDRVYLGNERHEESNFSEYLNQLTDFNLSPSDTKHVIERIKRLSIKKRQGISSQGISAPMMEPRGQNKNSQSETFVTELFFNQLPKNIFVNCSSEDFHKESKIECADPEMLNSNNVRLKIYKGAGSGLAPSFIKIRPTTNTLNIKLTIYGGSRCHIGKNCQGNWALRLWNNSSLIIGDDCTSNGCKIICDANCVIQMGNDCMLSEEILIEAGDKHALVDLTDLTQINDTPSTICIQDHCWLGRGSKIISSCQTITMGSGSILGSNSILTKSTSKATVNVGSPAKPTRSNVSWTRSKTAREEDIKNLINRFSL